MSKIPRNLFIATLVACQSYSTTQCVCSQLLSQSDCTRLSSQGCAWNSTTNVCATDTNTGTPTTVYPAYCDSYSQTDCPNTNGCAWVNSACVFFTGCTPFALTTDSDCQALSNKCITDGTHCVQINSCGSYLKQQPCVKNTLGSYCYWDSTNTLCVDANTCDKLPITLTTDALCRAQISTCTVDSDGTGCVTSGTNCSDQTTEGQCVQNLGRTTQCFWNGTGCVDRTCDNALTSLTTNDQCIAYLATCTTKSGGGCVTRTTCGAATIQAACVKNSTGGDCYWNSTACVDKTCANAPTTMTTNTACSGYLAGCITKSGGGCVTNAGCSAANVQAACVQNSSGTLCIWDTTCKEKTCANAPSTNNTHDLCTAYLSTCTVNASNNGCTNRSCANAPTTITSNADCNTYLPNQNCITKLGGGCVTNTTCGAITAEGACVTNVNGGTCFWDVTCKDKTCVNAPTTLTTDSACSGFLSTCTVNSSNAGCVDKTCENSLTSALCVTDLNNKPCIYKPLCYQKQCSLAGSLTTHDACNSYLNSCTLSNTGTGCVQIPLTCSAISIQLACYKKRLVNAATGVVTYGDCGWNGSQCIDSGCTTISATTTTACNSARSGCVSSNSLNANTVYGCIDRPATCALRKTQDNCETGGGVTCLWDSVALTCLEKSCATASNANTTGNKVGSINAANCNTYLTGCLVNNNSDGCIAPVANCNSLQLAANCIDGAKTNSQDCLWNVSCMDKTCANLPSTLTTHSDCQTVTGTINGKCTVATSGTGCQSLATSCQTYTTKGSCQINSSNKTCTWTATGCRDSTCADAPNTNAYQTNDNCSGYAITSGTCTVLSRIGTAGCVPRLAACTSYVDQNQCQFTLSNTSGTADCLWDGDSCQAIASFDCAGIYLGTYDDTNCSGKNPKCKANGSTACQAKSCADFTTATGGGALSVASDCSTQLSTCTINAASPTKGCQVAQTDCGGYTTAATCSFTSSGAACFFDTTCKLASSITTCATFVGVASTTTCEGYKKSCKSDNTNCVDKACTDYTTQNGLTGGTAITLPSHCSTLLSTCTIMADATTCQTQKAACGDYGSEEACSFVSGGICKYDSGTSACISGDCPDVPARAAGSYTNAECKAIKSTCSVNGDGTSCLVAGACNTYATTSAATCGYDSNGLRCVYTASPASCASFTTCAAITGSGLTDTDCASYNSSCIANRTGSACAVKQANCSSYSLIANCTKNSSGVQCVQNQYNDSGATCSTFAATIACASLFVQQQTYDHGICNGLNSTCTVNSSANGCVAKSCDNATAKASFSDCNTWLSTCTWNGTSACVAIAATCSSQQSSACYRATEGDCTVVNSQCVKKQCQHAATSVATDANCSSFLSTCTVARVGGCQARAACSTYVTQLQCVINSSAANCFWNPTALTCVDLTCSNIEQTTSYDTHGECSGASSSCTVRASNGAAAPGCMNKAACSSYTIQDQCVSNASGALCQWNTDLTTPACQDKSCTSAPLSTVTHATCQSYFSATGVTCTVAATNPSGTVIYAGCQNTADCTSYIGEEQCQVNASGAACGWNGSACANKSCATAPTATYTTHTSCYAYFNNKCTVAANTQGCIDLTTCENYSIQDQCNFDASGKTCYWDSTNGKCITRTCDNAPTTYTTDTECNNYLTGCTLDSVKCKTKVCEDFAMTTDSACQSSLAGCTTDGTKCVTRGLCTQALVEAGCVTSSTGALCQWVAASGTVQAYCATRTCATAPTATYTSEAQCSGYYTGCTVKSGGGCVTKTTCAAAAQGACTTASDGTICAWDSTANACRNKACQDFSGTSHSACWAQRTGCTVGASGKCAAQSTCTLTTIREACISGTDGPCLWISGACYPYTACSSLTWTTDTSCKQISSRCTTNGTNCVGITLCTETNTAGGCVTGYDGSCIQSVPALNSNAATQCYAYTSCSQAFYATHAACQVASNKCTTDGTTGCIALAGCSSYTQAGCYVNNVGAVTTNGLITSTGVCTWDNTANNCRDQICTDLTGTNNAACYLQLSTCTSNGTACIARAGCSTYADQTTCQTAVGTDGTCFWDSAAATPACRVMVCSDVTGGTSTAVCSAALSGCVSNGTICIAKSTCSTYTTKVACNSQGTDGICVFTAATGSTTTGTCALMTGCSVANSDQVACAAAKDRCAWTAATATVASSCATHTCATNQSTNGSCGKFLNWAKSLQQVCTLVSGVCTATDPTTLSSTDCYSVSGYTYTWNTSTSKCAVCTTVPDNNTNNNTNNNSNGTNTNNGIMLGLSTIILGYIMF